MITETEFKDALARYPAAAPLSVDAVVAGGRRRMRRRRLAAVAGSGALVLVVAGGIGAVLAGGDRPTSVTTPAVTPSTPVTPLPGPVRKALTATASEWSGRYAVRYVTTTNGKAQTILPVGIPRPSPEDPRWVGLRVYLVEFALPNADAAAPWNAVYSVVNPDGGFAVQTPVDQKLPLESLGKVVVVPADQLPEPPKQTTPPDPALDAKAKCDPADDEASSGTPSTAVLDMVDVVRRDLGKPFEVHYVDPGPNPGYAVVEFCGDAVRGYYPVGSPQPIFRMEVNVSNGTSQGRSFPDITTPLSSYGEVHHLAAQ